MNVVGAPSAAKPEFTSGPNPARRIRSTMRDCYLIDNRRFRNHDDGLQHRDDEILFDAFELSVRHA